MNIVSQKMIYSYCISTTEYMFLKLCLSCYTYTPCPLLNYTKIMLFFSVFLKFDNTLMVGMEDSKALNYVYLKWPGKIDKLYLELIFPCLDINDLKNGENHNLTIFPAISGTKYLESLNPMYVSGMNLKFEANRRQWLEMKA